MKYCFQKAIKKGAKFEFSHKLGCITKVQKQVLDILIEANKIELCRHNHKKSPVSFMAINKYRKLIKKGAKIEFIP